MSPVDDGLWRALMTPVRDRWKARAADPGLTTSQNAYARARATRLEKSYESRTERCETSGVMVRCACPGKRARLFSCRQHLVCPSCQRRRAKTLRARMRSAIDAAGERNAKRGRIPVFVTLTVPHGDDVAEVRRGLCAAWRRFYKALRRRIGAFEYVAVHEITAGRDGLGHPHVHLLVWWPYFPWKIAYALWTWAAPGAKRLDLDPARSVRGAAKYMGKYLSKGVDTDDFTPQMRARVLAGTYGSRWVFTSVRFWVPFVPLCPSCGQSVCREIVRIRGASDIRWTAAVARSTRGGFLDDEHIRGYQFAIE